MGTLMGWKQNLIIRFDELLQSGQYEEIYKLLQTDTELIDQINDLAIARVMLSVCEQEREAGQRILFEKVNCLEDLVRRYTVLMFYLRRFEFDVMDDAEDAFNRFLEINQVSLQELFAVMYCGNIDKGKVLQIIKDKIKSGEIMI